MRSQAGACTTRISSTDWTASVRSGRRSGSRRRWSASGGPREAPTRAASAVPAREPCRGRANGGPSTRTWLSSSGGSTTRPRLGESRQRLRTSASTRCARWCWPARRSRRTRGGPRSSSFAGPRSSASRPRMRSSRRSKSRDRARTSCFCRRWRTRFSPGSARERSVYVSGRCRTRLSPGCSPSAGSTERRP